MKKFVILLLFAAAVTIGAQTVPETIIPGALWPDNRSEHIQAHGGGIIKLGDTYYWFGEYRARDNNPSKRYIGCYSSTNLVSWKFQNVIVCVSPLENLASDWVLERPKVFHNVKTGKFVMYAHIDDGAYKLARVAVFMCNTVDGNYTYLRSFRPLGCESRDIGQFIDDDGAAYLTFEDRPNGFHIAKLSDDYLNIEKEICLVKEPIEGGALVHYHGLYYFIGSHLTGWAPNPNVYATAKTLSGPWSKFKNIAPPKTNTYGSQSTMMLKIIGTKATTVIFMGDIWNPQRQWDSRYLWMPLKIGNGTLELPEPHEWVINVRTGEVF